MDSALQNKLWSAALMVFEGVKGFSPEEWRTFTRALWIHFFNRPIDSLPADFHTSARLWYYKAQWFQVYDFLEAVHSYLPSRLPSGHPPAVFSGLVNTFLEQEMSAYRMVDGKIAPITADEEVQAIEEAIAETADIVPVQTHLKAALAMLTSRTAPDYRNSVKESISAVEAVCQQITGMPSATLGDALKALKAHGIPLHGALERGWSSIYGYTSDAGGIRHALSDQPDVTFSDAKYMLVSCSAFVSHLRELARLAEVKFAE